MVALIKYSSDKMIPARKCRDFLLSTNNVRFLSMNDENIEKFKAAARPYGLKFLHIHDSNGDGLSTIMVRGEDAAIINRLIQRNQLDVMTDVTQEEIEADPERAAEINEPIPEVVVDRDGVRVQDAVQDSRASAQEMVSGVEAANPANGRAAEGQSRPSVPGLQYTERTPAEAEELWNDVSASIDKSFEEMVEEKRQRKLELYNQDDPLLSKTGAPRKVQTKTSVQKELNKKKDVVKSMKQQRVKAALEKQQTVKKAVQKTVQR